MVRIESVVWMRLTWGLVWGKASNEYKSALPKESLALETGSHVAGLSLRG